MQGIFALSKMTMMALAEEGMEKKREERREKMGENCARDKRQEVLARRPIKVLLKYRYMLCSRLYVYMAIISLVYK